MNNQISVEYTYFYEYKKLDDSIGSAPTTEEKYHFLISTGLYTIEEYSIVKENKVYCFQTASIRSIYK